MQMNDSDLYILLLFLLPGVGPSRYWSWINIHQTPEKTLLAPLDQLPKLSPPAKKMLREFQLLGENSPLAIKGLKVLEALSQNDAHLITHQHVDYPGLLRQIERPPPLLFVKGNVELLSLPQIAIVGTRNPTATGIENTRAFSRFLAMGGFTITSGLALGIDGFAHEAALNVSGKTIAVMATGIDKIYPFRHQRLADTILEKDGLLITEFALGTAPLAANFPQRNRIISGLSLGVLVMEAAVKSGSLITARFALEQNREVFAVPGSIHNPQSKGCHALIKQGAQLVETGEDIIKQLAGLIHYFASQQNNGYIMTQPEPEATAFKLKLNELEQTLLRHIGFDTIDIDQLIERSSLTSAQVAATLFNLELKGAIKHSDWGYEAINNV
jgi:DNA processing protein